MPLPRFYGCKHQTPDSRDLHFARSLAPVVHPPRIDMRAEDTPINDHGQLGCCKGFATKAAYLFDNKRQFGDVFDTSPMFIYFNERLEEGRSIRGKAGRVSPGSVRAY